MKSTFNGKPGGERRSSKPDSTWVQGRLVPRHRVLVAADIHLFANHKCVQLTFNICSTKSSKNKDVNKIRLVKGAHLFQNKFPFGAADGHRTALEVHVNNVTVGPTGDNVVPKVESVRISNPS